MPEHENMEKRKLTSAVVMSKSFKEEREKRDRSRERKEREVKPRRMFDSDDETRENKRRQRRNRGSPDNAGITERRRVTDRLSRHTKDEEDEEGESNKRRERNKRYNERNLESERPDGWRETAGRRGRDTNLASGQERRSVFDRLDRFDQGPRRSRPMGRSQMPGSNRMVEMEVEVNPQDVPRGKRYFLHDDRELPRRPMGRARSRSPVWSHDMFDELMQEDDPEGNKETKEKEEKHESEKEREVDRERGRPRMQDRSRRVFR